MSGGSRLSIDAVVNRIVERNKRIRGFWSNAHGWAPSAAAQLLSNSRLDWQVSLSRCLHLWTKPLIEPEASGRLILGYANLGSLVEGTMKLFLAVYYKDYRSDADAIREKKKGNLQDPDSLRFEALRQFLQKKKIWKKSWDAWLSRIQQHRNAIHSFKNRDIGTQKELLNDIRKYLEFLENVDDRLPYPDSEGPDWL
jgi:hypothetical protein